MKFSKIKIAGHRYVHLEYKVESLVTAKTVEIAKEEFKRLLNISKAENNLGGFNIHEVDRTVVDFEVLTDIMNRVIPIYVEDTPIIGALNLVNEIANVKLSEKLCGVYKVSSFFSEVDIEYFDFTLKVPGGVMDWDLRDSIQDAIEYINYGTDLADNPQDLTILLKSLEAGTNSLYTITEITTYDDNDEQMLTTLG